VGGSRKPGPHNPLVGGANPSGSIGLTSIRQRPDTLRRLMVVQDQRNISQWKALLDCDRGIESRLERGLRVPQLKPFYEQLQQIYDDDHSTDFLGLFLDRTMLYSCAYFERDDMTLEQAQYAKLDLALGKCDLRPGQKLLEIGCGWGACSFRAAANYGVNVIALTLSKGQQEYCLELMKKLPPGSGTVDVRLQGWEEFDGSVDHIVSIAAFEHFRPERHAQFFTCCRKLLPANGRMLLHCICIYNLNQLASKGIEVTHDNALFLKFMAREIFPGGYCVNPDRLTKSAEVAGLTVTKAQSLQQHYARTLDAWATNLEMNQQEAVRRKSRDVYDRYMKYLTGCADHFRTGHIDVFQFTMVPA
jgi:cyclopropane-fatty-acyl-phospholipid synthase